MTAAHRKAGPALLASDGPRPASDELRWERRLCPVCSDSLGESAQCDGLSTRWACLQPRVQSTPAKSEPAPFGSRCSRRAAGTVPVSHRGQIGDGVGWEDLAMVGGAGLFFVRDGNRG